MQSYAFYSEVWPTVLRGLLPGSMKRTAAWETLRTKIPHYKKKNITHTSPRFVLNSTRKKLSHQKSPHCSTGENTSYINYSAFFSSKRNTTGQIKDGFRQDMLSVSCHLWLQCKKKLNEKHKNTKIPKPYKGLQPLPISLNWIGTLHMFLSSSISTAF